MRPDQGNNPLDLNNFPEDFSRIIDGNLQASEETSPATTTTETTRFTRKKKSSSYGKQDGKDDECGKVYECRFCSLKFCKSQALGGHMNRHRQERETEQLNRARQLVFSNDPLAVAAQGCTHIGLRDPNLNSGKRPIIPAVNFHHQGGGGGGGGGVGDPSHQQFRSSIYPTRLFSGSSSTVLQPPPTHQHYIYSTSPPSRLPSYLSQYPPHRLMNDNYFINGVAESNNYTCIGAPLGNVFPHDHADRSSRVLSSSLSGTTTTPTTTTAGRGGVEGSLMRSDQEDGLIWGPSSVFARTQQQQH